MRFTSRAVSAACVAMLCALSPLASHAQSPAATPAARPATEPALTLAEAYRLAFVEDATIRAARAQADARRERLPQARAALLPNISASYGRNHNHLESTSPGITGPVVDETRYGSSSKVLTLRQPIFRPYQIADLAQARAVVADANAQLDKETQNLAVRVTSAYLDCLLAQDQLALILAQKSTYTTQLDAAKKRFSAGAGVRTDIDDAQAKLDFTIATELQLRQNVDYTRRVLQVLINRPVTALAPVDPARLKLGPPVPAQLDEWQQRAELTSPELRSMSAQRDASRREIDKARAGHLPTLDFVAQRSISNSENVTRINSNYDNTSFGIQLNIPIFAGGGVTSQTRQAVADTERAEQALEATRRDLALRIEQEFRGVTEGVAKVAALEKAVQSAEVMVRSTRRSYEGGVRTVVDILAAEEQRVTALRDLAQARYLYLLSRVRLQALTGVADETAIAEINSTLAP
ncbi:TolC family outer membrane protein [Ramlibacter sp. PS4R-6]|uniref:TolC family outer membrane protein n=1 Tax=Ramlibacter sp. PS4R-6 TaxID=3133438 RepID=UPI0030A8A011